jgi:hypothetical protein
LARENSTLSLAASLSFANRVRSRENLTLSLCDVPLLHKERDVLAKPKQGEVKGKLNPAAFAASLSDSLTVA